MVEKVAQTGAQAGLAAPTADKTFSQSTTMDSTYEKTLNGHGSPEGKITNLPATSALSKEEELIRGGEGFHGSSNAVALSSLPAGRKSILLLCFCLAYVPSISRSLLR